MNKLLNAKLYIQSFMLSINSNKNAVKSPILSSFSLHAEMYMQLDIILPQSNNSILQDSYLNGLYQMINHSSALYC